VSDRQVQARRRLLIIGMALAAFVVVAAWPYKQLIGADAQRTAQVYASSKRPDVRFALEDPSWRAAQLADGGWVDSLMNTVFPDAGFAGVVEVKPLDAWTTPPNEAVFVVRYESGAELWARLRRAGSSGPWRVISLDSGG